MNDFGKRFQVGIYHGNTTGHLMIYCNSRVVIIDFHVLETKTYSLFLDEDLCEIIVEKCPSEYRYGFEVNKEVDTPLNRQRKAIERKHWIQTLLFFGGLLVCVGLFTFWMLSTKGQAFAATPSQVDQKALLLTEPTNTAVGKLFVETEGLRCTFVADGQIVEKVIDRPLNPILSNGMPLITQDEFHVQYLKENPYVFNILYDQPSENQIQKYLDRSRSKHLKQNPNLHPTQANCMVKIAYDLKGIDGLADIFFQDASEGKNPDHNNLTYKKLIRDIPFKQRSEQECL